MKVLKLNTGEKLDFFTAKSTVTLISRFRQNELSPSSPTTRVSCYIPLKQLQRAHFLLCEVSRNIDNFYSIQNLLQLISCFVCTVSYTYAFVMNVFKLKISTSKYAEDHIALSCFLLVIVNIWWLGSITYSSEVVRREFGNTGRLVKKLLLLLPTPVDRSCPAELQLFAQQLAGRSVSYSAAGLFSLDLSMVKPAVATAATYLVVLVQFGLSDISKQSNNGSNYLNETSR
ncbi:putative gustatory receptor 28a [Schistocerca serialis cubense]|uniref:putative gustatory receptor 28a n=1 Tax=Schistocerca serialis cubense TaxID=2023355 RepID=UPI00214E4578|nr:putative gustatory receptor 28a [Schistocerca serialis cubense]